MAKKKAWEPHPDWVRLQETAPIGDVKVGLSSLKSEIAICVEQGRTQRLQYLIPMEKYLEDIIEARTGD